MDIKTVFSKCKGHATTLVWLTALIIAATVLLAYERHVLWKIQEQSLFLDTSLFFRQQMVAPGGLLTYVGSFLTQLLYYPVLGVAVLCVWWGLLLELMRRTFRIGNPWSMLLLVPIALLLVANVDMGYWIYPIKLKGWYFDATVGLTAVVALLLAYRSLSAHRMWRRVLLLLTVVVGYLLIGSYALAAAVLMSLWSWRLDGNRWQALTENILAVLAVVAVPLLAYQYVYYQTNMVNLWWTALPVFKILEVNQEYYVPYALLGVSLVVLVFVSGKKESVSNVKAELNVTKVAVRSKKKDARAKKTPKGWWKNVVVAGMLAAMVVGVWAAWMKDENFHREIAMERYVEQTRWEDVLAEAAKQKDVPSRAIVMMRNLALTRLGRQSTEMYRYPNGSKKPASPFAPPSSMLVGDMIYYHYGMLNDSRHMCIEGGVEFGWRVEHLKYLARCALMANEVNVMYKYVETLKHTMFHRQWASRLETLQQQPQVKREDSETGPIMHMMHYPDMVGTDHGYTERYVMNHLAAMDSDDPYLQEQCLLAALWAKDSRLFWPRFANYLRQHPGEPIPRYYLEAALLFADTEGNAPFRVNVDEYIKKMYKEFTGLLAQYDGKDLTDVREALYPMYGDTYFFQFFLTDDLLYN